MQPLDDGELSKMLSEWRAPRAPDSLEQRLLREERQSPWQWLVRGRIQVPVPLAAALLMLLVWGTFVSHRGPSAEPQPAAGLSGFQLAEDFNPRIIRSTHEDD